MNPLRVLILTNRLKVGIADDVQQWIKYDFERLGITVIPEYKECDLQLKFKSFGVFGTSRDPQGNTINQELYGTDGIKEQVRELVAEGEYHMVIFAYDFEHTDMYKTNPGAIGHWTYYNPLYPGTIFIEIATTKIWDDWNDFFRVVTHEARHAYVQRARWRGVPVTDVMDKTYLPCDCTTRQYDPAGKCVDGFPYFKEFEPYAPVGNRAIQDALLKPSVSKIVYAPELKGYIKRLWDAVNALRKQILGL